MLSIRPWLRTIEMLSRSRSNAGGGKFAGDSRGGDPANPGADPFITIVPAQTGRGVDIEIEGRLNAMIALATGQPLVEPLTLALERVKGIEPSS